MKLDRKWMLELGLTAALVYLVIYYWEGVMSTFGLLFQAASPLIFGAATAYIVNILMSFYERQLARIVKKPGAWQRSLCVLLAFVSVLLVLYVVIHSIVPELYSCFQVLISALPSALKTCAAWLEENLHISGLLSTFELEWSLNQNKLLDAIQKGINVLLYGAGNVMSVVLAATGTVVSSLITVFLGLVFAVHLLLGKDKLYRQCSRLMHHFLPAKYASPIGYFLNVLHKCFHSYIVGQVLEACILGGLCALGMIIFGFPYALMIGALIGVTALIPIAGAYIGGAVGFIMIFSADPLQAVFFVIYLVILQQLEGNLIYPRVVGSSLGLPGIWVLAAVTIGGGLMGITGMLISVPFTAAVYRILREKINGIAPGPDSPET